MPIDGNAEKARTPLIFADRDHGAPERGAQDETHHTDRQRKAKQHEVVERVGVRQDVDPGDAEIERLARKAAQPVVAAGDGAPLERDVVEDLPERDGDHREVDAASPCDERAQQCAGNAAEQRAAQQRERCARREKLQREAGAIGTEPEIRRVSEGQHTGEAEQEVHRHGCQSEHEHARAERGVAAEQRHPVGRQQERCPECGDDEQPGRVEVFAHVIMPSSPSRPRGRISRTTAISTYMMASLAAGRNTAVMPEATPISKPPSSVPVRLPTPPTMMAMKLGIRRPVPIVGSSPSWPAASTPLRPARKTPTAKLSARSLPTLSGRNGHGLALRTPDEAGAILDHEGEAERQQQAVERIAPVDSPDEHPLDGETDDSRA